MKYKMRSLLTFVLVAVMGGCGKKDVPASTAQAMVSAKVENVDLANGATVAGIVRFDGVAPMAEKIDMTQDPGCAFASPDPNFSQAYLISDGKVENVYVYVKEASNGVTQAKFSPPVQAAVLDQRGCRYTPHVMAVMAGQNVRIENNDMTMHNVHPNPEKNRIWNVSQQPKGEAIEQMFAAAEVMIPVKCNQHPWMKMFLNVSAHPYFAITGKDGQFEIRGLPAGEYTIAAVHERMGEKTMKVTIGTKENKKVEFGFKAGDSRATDLRDR